MVLCLYATRAGIFVSQDSAAYLGAASNLLHGKGLSTPFTLSESTLSPARAFLFHGAIPLVHFPPLYPVALALVSLTSLSMVESARWLNAVLLAFNLVIFELLVRRLTRSNVVLPVLGALLLLVGPAILYHQNFLTFHTGVLSEPLFIFDFLATILLVDMYMARPSRAVLVGILLGVAAGPLIRYAGVSVAVAAAFVLFVWSPIARRQRVFLALATLACGALPSLSWSLWSAVFWSSGSARNIAWHPESSIVRSILDIVSGWLLPSSVSSGIRDGIFLMILCVAAALVIASGPKTFIESPLRAARREAPAPPSSVSRVLALAVFAVSYLALVVVTRELFDALLSMSNRTLLPLLPLLYLILLASIANAVKRPAWAGLIAGTLCVIIVSSSIGATLSFASNPPDLAPVWWQLPLAASSARSGTPTTWPTMQALRLLPRGTLIVSSVPDLIYTGAGQPSIGLPTSIESIDDKANLRYDAQLQQMATLLIDHHGLLVVIPEALADSTRDSAVPSSFAPYRDWW